MKSYVYILYKLAWAAGMLPPDAVAAMLLVSLGAPSAVAAFLAGLPWILDLLLGGVVTGYLKGLLGYHIWREIPPGHQRFTLGLRDRALFKANVKMDNRGEETSSPRASWRLPRR